MVRATLSLALLCAACAVAVGAGETGTASEPAGTLLWSTERGVSVTSLDGAVLGRFGVEGDSAVELSPDGRHIAVADSRLRLIEVRTREARVLVDRGSVLAKLTTPRFSPNGRHLAVADGPASCVRQQPRAAIVRVDLANGDRSRLAVWPRARPWRKGDFTRFVTATAVSDEGGVWFREERYVYGECRYQDLREERYWHGRPAADPLLILRDGELGDIENSPDGTRVAYAVGAGDECEVHVSGARGQRPRLVASRSYVALGCSRGIHGMSLLWAPNGKDLYYSDGSSIYVWNETAGSRLLLRPPASPGPACAALQSCFQHVLADMSSDGSWLVLEQDDPSVYTEPPRVLLVDIAARRTRIVRRPSRASELESARLD